MRTTSDIRTELLPRTPIPSEATRRREPRDSRRPEQYYVGRRTQKTEVYVVSATAIEPLDHHGYRSAARFDWGAPTAGALELAYSILVHSTASQPPGPICVTFCTEVVACLDHPGFVLGYGDLALWLLTAFHDGKEPSSTCRLSLRDRVGRMRSWIRRE